MEVQTLEIVRKKKWTHEPHLNGAKFPGSNLYSGEISHPIASIAASGRATEWALTAAEKEKQDVPVNVLEYFVARMFPLTTYEVQQIALDRDYSDTSNEVYAIKAVGKPMNKRSRTANMAFRVAIVIDNPDTTANDTKLIGAMSDMFVAAAIVGKAKRNNTPPPGFRWYVFRAKWFWSFNKRIKV